MRLEKQEIIDLLYGCAVTGIWTNRRRFPAKELFLATGGSPGRMSVCHVCGSPASLDKCGKEYEGFRYWAIRNLCLPSVHWKREARRGQN